MTDHAIRAYGDISIDETTEPALQQENDRVKGKNEKTKPTKLPSEEYANLEKLAKALIAVPKSEIDKRQAEYAKSRKAAKKTERHDGVENDGRSNEA